MQIHFTGRKLEITPAMKSYTTEKLEHLSSRHNVTTINVTLHVENMMQIAEATVHYNGTDLHATGKATDMYAAIDMVADKLTAQINKSKDKLTDRHRE